MSIVSIPFVLPSECSLTDAAVLYASHGFRVLPVYGVHPDGACQCSEGAGCKSPGKHPVGKEWQKRATSDVDAVRDARRGFEHANVGLAMGPCELGYLVCIDIDDAEPWDELCAARDLHFPDTLTARTGRASGGTHLFFKLADHHDPKRLKGRPFHKGCDVKVAGGQVLAAPSMHRSGAQYAWVNVAPIATLSDELYEVIATPPRREATPPSSETQRSSGAIVYTPKPGSGNADEMYVQKALDNACTDIARCPEGNRNATLNKLASVVFQYAAFLGWSESRAMGPLESAALVAGLDRAEVRATLASAWRYAVGSPRAVPAMPDRGVVFAGDAGSEESRISLATKKNGKIETCLANAVDILVHDARWSGCLKYNAFAHEVTVSDPPWAVEAGRLDSTGDRVWSDLDDERLQSWLFRAYGVEFSSASVRSAVRIVANRSAVHPVTDYLSGLTWDGVPRCAGLFASYMNATNSPDYLRAISVRWMVSAVARVFEPGCKVDFTPILEGAQDLQKSTAIRALASGPWFRDSAVAIGHKDGYDILRGCWILEFGELDSVSRYEVTKVKAFLTSCVDSYRPPYLRRTIDVPRQTVFVGSTNEKDYLKDPTGNRRFWPVACGATVDVARLLADRDQLWAEAVALYRSGQAWWVDSPELKALCAAEQAEREPTDEWVPMVQEWLSGSGRLAPVTVRGALMGALLFEKRGFSRADENRMGTVLRTLGYTRAPRGADDRRTWVKSDGDRMAGESAIKSNSAPSRHPAILISKYGYEIDSSERDARENYIYVGGGTFGGRDGGEIPEQEKTSVEVPPSPFGEMDRDGGIDDWD